MLLPSRSSRLRFLTEAMAVTFVKKHWRVGRTAERGGWAVAGGDCGGRERAAVACSLYTLDE
jgi:hypothetical protein